MNQAAINEDFLNDIIPDDQQEDESDLDDKKISFKDSVVMNADWTIETINSQVIKKNIDLDPGFQRRSAWDETRQSRLIESIIVGMPIPNIVLAENKTNRGRFIVIDGKQRLLTINDFIDDKFTLRGLDIRTDLNGLKYTTLAQDDREFLENSTLRSTVIKNWSDENFLFTIFFRLNSGSLPLSPQELRKALIGGRLLRAIEVYIQNSKPFHSLFGTVADKRMRDSELVLRFIAFDRFYDTYNGNLKDLLDETTRFYETSWDNEAADLKTRFERLDRALSTAHSIFGNQTFKKWLGAGYERRINRAIFDSITRFFADEAVAVAAEADSIKIVTAFQDICMTPAFKDAIEKTTKSLGATNARISGWGRSLADAVEMEYIEATARVK